MYKRKLLTVAILVLVITLFGGGCAKNTIDSSNSDTQSKFTVNIMNSSDALISEIQYQSQNEGGGMLNADGSLMRKNDTFQLNFDNPKKSLLISILNGEREVLFAKTISLDFNSERIVNLKIINVSDGIDLISSK